MRKIMRATLHDHAPNTYYGQWPGEKPLFPGLESPAIAHDELVASARVRAFDVPERDFPGNHWPPRCKFVCRPKRKSARQTKVARSQRRPREGRYPSSKLVTPNRPARSNAGSGPVYMRAV